MTNLKLDWVKCFPQSLPQVTIHFHFLDILNKGCASEATYILMPPLFYVFNIQGKYGRATIKTHTSWAKQQGLEVPHPVQQSCHDCWLGRKMHVPVLAGHCLLLSACFLEDSKLALGPVNHHFVRLLKSGPSSRAVLCRHHKGPQVLPRV